MLVVCSILRGKLGLKEFQQIADSLVEIEHVPAVEVSVELGKEAELVAGWPALLDKEGIGYDFWGMCEMDWNTLEKRLRKERKLSYTVTYCDRQENQMTLEFAIAFLCF